MTLPLPNPSLRACVVVPARNEEVPATRADTTLCRKLLGITFETDLRALVKRQVDALQVAAPSGLQEVG